MHAGGQRFESVILHIFVKKRIDEVNQISDMLMIGEVNPALDTVEVLIRKEIFDILTHDKTVESSNS